MDTRPIGIFDSGLGGLTAVRALVEAAPWESFVYLGDTANAPYGDKTPEQLEALSQQNIRFLHGKGVKAFLVACNTSTANTMDVMLAERRGLPLVGVIRPAAEAAVKATSSGRVAVMATAATARSGAYERAVKELMPDARVTVQSCPKLVPLVEGGHTDPADPALTEAVEEYTAPIRAAGADTVVLGCTHYPIIRAALEDALGPDVALIDSGAVSVGALLDTLARHGALGNQETPGSRQFYCSAGKELFTAVGSAFLGWDMSDMTEEVSFPCQDPPTKS